MNKTELVEAIASSTELTKTDVDKVVTALVEVVTDALAKGDKVSLKCFGKFFIQLINSFIINHILLKMYQH